MGFGMRLKHAWNAFFNRDPTNYSSREYGHSYKPDRLRLTRGNEKTIVTSIYNRLALDVSSIDIFHAKIDENKRFLEEINSSLNNCLTSEANIDQTGRAFIQDVVMSMFDEGCVAIVPIDMDIGDDGEIDIESMRTGKILEWYPEHIKVRVYNERTCNKEDIIVPKRKTAIIENPFYAVMNEPNSTMQRLIRKLSLLDAVDEQNSSGKLDLIIQLPYVIKNNLRKQQAEERRKDITEQLANSKYGIAYTDGSERITQLNRPVENNLIKQVEYLSNTLYSQLNITQSIMDGSADEKTMTNYFSRTIEPIISAITEEMNRKFLSKEKRTKNENGEKEAIIFCRNPFKLIPTSSIAELADKLTRNEIVSSNEIRQVIGLRPSKDPRADELLNKNINHPAESQQNPIIKEENQNE